MPVDNGTILVVDDEQRMCDSIEALLVAEGYKVATSLSGKGAIDLMQQGGYDLVITDLKMPQVDGLDVLEAVRKISPETLVIIITGYASLESAMSAIGKGAYDYLTKPVEFQDLKLTVQRGLEKRRIDQARKKLLAELKVKNSILERKVQELDALYQTASSLSSVLDIDLLLNDIVSAAARVIGAKIGSVMLLDEETNELVIRAAIGLEPEIVHHTRLAMGKSISGYVAKNGEPLLVKDIEEDSRFARISRERYETKSLLSVPLKVKDKIIGVINMNNKISGAIFDEDDMRLLTTIAFQAAIAIDNARLFEEKKRKIAERSVLYELASGIGSAGSFDEVAKITFNSILKLMKVSHCSWFTWDERSQKLDLAYAQGENYQEEMPQFVSQTEETLKAIGRMELDAHQFKEEIDAALGKIPIGGKDPKWSIKVPIVVEGKLLGILCVCSSHMDLISRENIRLISIIASQASSLYERQRAILSATQLVTMGKMVSEITHEIKQPLSSIKGTLQLLKQRWRDETSRDEILNLIEEEIFRLSQLVQELVSFSNPNKYQVKRQDIHAVVERALALVKQDLARREISLQRNYSDVLPLVLINENEMLQALLNIILNAMESMQQGGRLAVATALSPNLDEKRRGGGVDISISDSGIGISEENLKNIFRRYFTTKDGGSGLGLSVVTRIVDAHHGHVKVKSQVGLGTTFTISLPVA